MSVLKELARMKLARQEEAVVLEGRLSKVYDAWYTASVQIAQAIREMDLKKEGQEFVATWNAIDALLDPALNEEVMEGVDLSELTRDISPYTLFMDAYKELLDADKEISSILKKRGGSEYSEFTKLNDKNHDLLKEVKKTVLSYLKESKNKKVKTKTKTAKGMVMQPKFRSQTQKDKKKYTRKDTSWKNM